MPGTLRVPRRCFQECVRVRASRVNSPRWWQLTGSLVDYCTDGVLEGHTIYLGQYTDGPVSVWFTVICACALGTWVMCMFAYVCDPWQAVVGPWHFGGFPVNLSSIFCIKTMTLILGILWMLLWPRYWWQCGQFVHVDYPLGVDVHSVGILVPWPLILELWPWPWKYWKGCGRVGRIIVII